VARTHLKDTDEQRGQVPSCTGALLEIVKIEKGKTGERAKNPGCLKYTPEFKIVEPKELKNMRVFDNRIVIGTPEDPRGKKQETWDNQEGGPGRLKRLMVRSGTPITDDDEEWMEAAEGNQVVAPLVADPEGQFGTAPGLYFRPSDDDAPAIAIAAEDGKGGRGKGKGAAAASKRARGRKAAEEEEEVDEEGEEEEEEEPVKKKSSSTSGKASKKSSKEDDEDEEEDDEEEEEEPRPKAARGKAKGKRKVEEEEDDD